MRNEIFQVKLGPTYGDRREVMTVKLVKSGKKANLHQKGLRPITQEEFYSFLRQYNKIHTESHLVAFDPDNPNKMDCLHKAYVNGFREHKKISMDDILWIQYEMFGGFASYFVFVCK